MIKKLSFSLLLSLMCSVGLTACSDSNSGGGSEPTTTDFTVTKTTATFAATGGTTDFSVSASSKPTVATDASWLKVSEKTSTSTTVFRYDLTADAYSETDDRSATVTITVGSTNKTIAVTQTSTDGLVISSDKSVTVGADGGTITVKLRANGSYSVNSSVEWITQSTRANMQDYEESFVVESNVGAARTGKISFTLNDITESVSVSQSQGNSGGNISKNAMQIGKLMYPGWNLGNTMEASATGSKGSLNSETSWQSTTTTQAIIDFVKEQGFKSVRIPCSWYYHATDGEIDDAWMGRVQEIVDYCIKDGLYVVLNDHWDCGWIEVEGFSESTSSYQKATDATVSAKSEMLKKIWTQIANHFKDYDEHLLFAGMNEPFQQYNLFNNHHAELLPILHKYNQAFVDAVRATGGNNLTRTLVVQGPSVSIESGYTLDFTMPTDINSQTGYMMAEFHYYEPWDFCGQESDGKFYWGSANHVSGSSYNCTWGEESWATTQMNRLKEKFFDNGYPVILGEYGCQWRDVSSVSGGNQTKHDASVKAWFKDLTQKAISAGAIPMAWDINSANQNGTNGTMTIINRAKLTVFCTPALEGIQEGVAAATWPGN